MKDTSEKFFFAKLNDMARLCEKNGSYCFSSFLDERQCAEAEMWCRKNIGSLQFMLWGGFEGAKRKILAVYQEYCSDFVKSEFPLKCVTFSYRKTDSLSHRDFLGTFMGMNLKRETIGDIVTGEGSAQAIVTETASKLICSSVSKIGKTGVKCTDTLPFEMSVQENFQTLSGTVASVRLDCIVSFATGKSRENAVKLIRSEKTDVNHLPRTSVSSEVREGDVISIRGTGRFVLKSIDGTTKKDRLHITMLKYI